MNKVLEEKNKKKHINAIAKDFICAMISSPQYWRVFYDFKESVERAFQMAEVFVEKEKKI